MDTRLILQIVLGTIIALIVVVGGLMIYTFTREAETVVVQDVVDETRQARERRNPWADQGEAAIALVDRVRVQGNPGVAVEGDNLTVGALLASEEFVREKLKITSGESQGWTAQWWGETKHGPSFFLVRYAFLDGHITVGPAWLVDLRTRKVVPKNVLAEVATKPEEGVKSDYYDQARQVVSAMTNHRFPSRINLGGALLRYFSEQETVEGEDNRVIGWTVDHDRNELFQAYFQWIEGGTPTYAHFEFDYKQRALRASNLQAHEIMRVGEEFEPLEKVTIMPRSYDPNQRLASARWQGGARRQCQQPQHRNGCRALATILDNADLIETLEWVLTADSRSAAQFSRCQQPPGQGQAPHCRWQPVDEGNGVFRVRYMYRLGDEEHEISWRVNVQSGRIEPVDSFSEIAFRAVTPRG